MEWLNYGVYLATLDAIPERNQKVKVRIKVYKTVINKNHASIEEFFILHGF